MIFLTTLKYKPKHHILDFFELKKIIKINKNKRTIVITFS